MESAPHQLSFARRPLVQLATSFAFGILVAQHVSLHLTHLLIWGGVIFASAGLALLKDKLRLATIFVTLAFFVAGSSLHSIEKQGVPGERVKHLLEQKLIRVGDPVELTGVLSRAPEAVPQGLYLKLQVELLCVRNVERQTTGVVLLLAPFSETEVRTDYENLALRYGARLRVMTTLDRADTFRNPGVSSFSEYLDQKGLDATGVIKSPLLIERLNDEKVFLPLAWLYMWRRSLEEQIHSRFSQETAALLDAALLGNRHFLSRPTAERFREGGTFHVLVISGMHISFIGGLVFLLVRRVTKRKVLQFILSTVVLWSYALAVGAESSVVRAALMFTVVAFAPLVARRKDSLNALGGAALVLLSLEPGDLFNPSFQLTFLSVLAITAVAWPLLSGLAEIGRWRPTSMNPRPPNCPLWLRNLCELFFWSERQWQREMTENNYKYRLFKSPFAIKLERYRLQQITRYALGAIVVSASVQVLLLPMFVLYFHRVSIASSLLNIGVGMGMAGLGTVSVAALLFAQLSETLAAPIVATANALGYLTIHAVDPFTFWGIASLRIPEYSGWPALIYLFYYGPLVLLIHLFSRRRALETITSASHWRWVAFAQGLLLTIILLHPFSSGPPDNKLRVDFLDVGQGDSILVTMPDGTTLLVDGGGRPNFVTGRQPEEKEPFQPDRRSIGEAVVSEFLWHRGLDSVDYILATHAHADHIDGLNDVARNFQVRVALVGRTPEGDPEYHRFSEAVRSRRIPIMTIAAGDVLRFGKVKADVLWPPPAAHSKLLSPNDDSVVLRIEFGQQHVLLTGDIEARAEASLVKGTELLRSNVVKVPHHGSKSSSTEDFVKATGARSAIISVGRTSIFGHPDPEVVKRWRAAGAEVLTTGTSGTIIFTTDGRDSTISTFVRD
jgi:competence protein ComEC